MKNESGTRLTGRVALVCTVWFLYLWFVGQGRLRLVPAKPSICAMWLRLALLGPQGPFLQVLNCFRGARFIAWGLKHPFFGEIRRGPRHFWNRRACLGYRAVAGSQVKKALYHTLAQWDAQTNTEMKSFSISEKKKTDKSLQKKTTFIFYTISINKGCILTTSMDEVYIVEEVISLSTENYVLTCRCPRNWVTLLKMFRG